MACLGFVLAWAGVGPCFRQAAGQEAGQEAGQRIGVTVGKVGSKARGAAPDLARRLRAAIIRDLKESAEVDVFEDERGGKGRFTIESSVTEMTRRTTASGEWEVICEVSVVIGLLPSRSIVGMTSGGATIQVPRRSPRLSKEAAMALENNALSSAVHGANQNLLAFLRNQK